MIEGGGRKGLPQSFLSRFSRVYVEAFSKKDMIEICRESYEKKLPASTLRDCIPLMVDFVSALSFEVAGANTTKASGTYL